MGQVAWLGRLVPSSLVLGVCVLLAAIVPADVVAGPPGKNAPRAACREMNAAEVARAAARERAAGAELVGDLALDPSGAVTGRRLTTKTAHGRVELSLPAESFVERPVGDAFVYGYHEPGRGSVIHAFLGESGCDGLIARPAGIVRSAVLDLAGTALYVHAVAPESRRDLGISRIDLATGAAEQVVAPPEDDPAFGPTFATELQLSVDGGSLAVQSCGGDRCRTRLLAIETSEVRTYAGEGHGDLVAVGAEALYVFHACHWAPCPLLRIDRATGAISEVASDAYSAELLGNVIRIETTAGTKEVAP